VPLHRLALHFLALVYANVARVGEHLLFMPVQQGMRLRHIRHVGRRANHTVDQARIGVHANVGFHPKVPFVALLRLMHLRVTALLGIFGRRRRFDDRRVNQRAFLHQQSSLTQRDANLVEQLAGQFVFVQQTPEFQQRGRVRHVLDRQIDAGEGAQRDAVIQRVFQPFVRQPVPLLQEVDPQHPLQANRRTPARALRVMRLDCRQQALPRHDLLHLGQEALAPRHALLACNFCFREADLPVHRRGSVP